ncbi:host attachment protein [Erythrobacter sp. SCSIO 43205]|uniref:host attachment family protein n=1 Tax=Erythrobacter sp. SCSIO 43205 TaxID=2779361 RepID=UPI001CA918E1|nr:host attachment family protein [Erythrobacter sp. SCSIO 43205]UAB78395.1 host attachment protein [Erythrobacter sp. SCSIO 43205]
MVYETQSLPDLDNDKSNVRRDCLVLIADGEKALFLRNVGDAKHPNLDVVRTKEQDNPPNREQAANRRGRMFDGTGHKSAVDDTDWHQLAKERFASELAEMLYKRAHHGEFDELIVAADPSTMGELRKEWHQEVEKRIIAEIDKDLTNHQIDEIEKLIAENA